MESSYSQDVVLLEATMEEQMIKVEENAALLGTASLSECTYANGYVDRQMVYSCRTCQFEQTLSDPHFQPGGFCYGCMMNCHTDHEIIQLYTRRNFKCDCGNSKFGRNQCKLLPGKDTLNTENKYDENFTGLPVGETIQCFVCETWILKPEEFPPKDDFDYDTTCHVCSDHLTFLVYYREYLKCRAHSGDDDIADPVVVELHKTRQADCELSKRFVYGMVKIGGVLVWEPKFRKLLCSCDSCRQMYLAKGVSFIIDSKDFLDTYYAVGLAAHDVFVKEVEEKVDKKMSSMGRYAKGELALGVGALKKGLTKMLQPMKKDNKVVTVKDVENMFGKLKRKKQ